MLARLQPDVAAPTPNLLAAIRGRSVGKVLEAANQNSRLGCVGAKRLYATAPLQFHTRSNRVYNYLAACRTSSFPPVVRRVPYFRPRRSVRSHSVVRFRFGRRVDSVYRATAAAKLAPRMAGVRAGRSLARPESTDDYRRSRVPDLPGPHLKTIPPVFRR